MSDTPASSTATVATPHAVTTSTTVSPGWRSSEHWLSLLAMIIGSLLAADVIPAGSVWLRIAGLASSVLAAMGYTWSRTTLKAAA